MGQERTLSLVIPAKDEQDNIAALITEIFRVMRDYPDFEVVLVDDGSSDQTLNIALRSARSVGGRLVTVRHDQSIGQSGALATGIRRARGTLIATMDGDGQNDPADIPALLQKVFHALFHVVFNGAAEALHILGQQGSRGNDPDFFRPEHIQRPDLGAGNPGMQDITDNGDFQAV